MSVEQDEALPDSEAKYRSLFESIDEGFCIIEVLFDEQDRPIDYRFLETNPAFERQTGLVDAVGRRIRELAPAHEPHWFDTYGRVARTGEPVRLEAPAEALGRHYTAYAFRVGRPEDGHVAVLFTDVTAMKAAERERERLVAALEVERSRLAAVFAQTPSVLAIVRGPQHVLDMANEAYLALNNYRVVLGKPLLDAVPELRGQGFERLLDEVVATGVPFVGREVPIWLSLAEGALPEERFYDFVYLPLMEADETGTPQRVGVIAHGNDITEQVRARREVERARERAERLQMLAAALTRASTPGDVARATLTHGLSAVDASASFFYGPGIAGGPLELLASAGGSSPEMLDELSAEAARLAGDAARTGAAIWMERAGERPRHRTSGAHAAENTDDARAIVALPIPVGPKSGAIVMVFPARREFAADDRANLGAVAALAGQALERARLFAAERRARADAEAASRAKSEFLAVMSHELRTPLNAIGGYAELIELGIQGPVTDAQRAALARIQSSQRHLLGLISGVLDYSRVDAGAVSYRLVNVPVAEAVAEAEMLVAPQLRAKGLGYSWAGAPSGLAVRADREKLQQILLNLLGNAIKFTHAGAGAPGRIEVSCSVEESAAGARVAIHVRDTGAGIEMAQLERVFEPFVQVDQRLTRAHEGVGLGLAISRDLARGMNGDITVESTPGKGSTFTLVLPGA